MNNRLFKILVLSIIVILLVSLACVSLVACGDKKKAEEVKKNDKEYALSDITGKWEAEAGMSTYYLTISSDGSAKCISQDYNQKRAGYSTDIFSGKVTLTTESIKISSYSGYIQTNSLGEIVIYLDKYTFKKA